MDVTVRQGVDMKTHPVTSLLVAAMNKAAAEFQNVPSKQRRYLEWRRYDMLVSKGNGTEYDLPDFLDAINFVYKNTPYRDDDVFLKIWYDALTGVMVEIQKEAIVEKLDTATPEECEKFVKAHINYIKHRIK